MMIIGGKTDESRRETYSSVTSSTMNHMKSPGTEPEAPRVSQHLTT